MDKFENKGHFRDNIVVLIELLKHLFNSLDNMQQHIRELQVHVETIEIKKNLGITNGEIIAQYTAHSGKLKDVYFITENMNILDSVDVKKMTIENTDIFAQKASVNEEEEMSMKQLNRTEEHQKDSLAENQIDAIEKGIAIENADGAVCLKLLNNSKERNTSSLAENSDLSSSERGFKSKVNQNLLPMVRSLLKRPVEDVSQYLTSNNFDELVNDREILYAIAALNFLNPSRVQEALIPYLIRNPPTNIWAASNAGAGKSLAYGIAILNRIDLSKNCTQALVIVPSYEAAVQIGELISRLSIFKNGRIGLAVPHDSSFVLHKDFHVIIGTQREVISFYLLGIFKMNDLAIVVFDDADTTATTVMIKDQILNKLPANCQKVFIASNKMRPLIDNLVEMKFFVDDNVFPHNIDNYFVECASNRKYEVIKALCVEANNDRANGKIIIFFTQKVNAQEFWEKLKEDGLKTSLLSSTSTYQDRQNELSKFRNGFTKVLLTTDVGAIGIDVKETKVVVNFDLALTADMKNPNIKLYLQRSSRAGRMGKSGVAITLVDSNTSRIHYRKICNAYNFIFKQMKY